MSAVRRFRRLLVLPFLIGTLLAHAGDRRPASIASGIVRNGLDEPVAGATVLVIRVRTVDGRTQFDELAQGVTDSSGRFAIPAETGPNDAIGLEVRAPGFMLWRRWAGGTVEDEPIVLNRVIDDAYFADLARERDPARRSSLLLDLVGRRALHSYDSDERIEQYYAHLGSIREDLLAIAQSEPLAVAQRAKNLLIHWFDPQDEPLIRQWVQEEALDHFRLDIDSTGSSPDEAWRAYAEAHFAREPKTLHYFTGAAYSPDCKHAYVVFVVRYANWGYWQPLVLLDEGTRWKVKLAGDGGRWHGLSPEGPAQVYPD
ncbi:MAG TPA: carboxypeptidase-like regulatory domain-containing protein [Thermoanaerobaculia bacterium]